MISDPAAGWLVWPGRPRDAHGLAVLIVAALLAVGTALPELGSGGPEFPAAPLGETNGRTPWRKPPVGPDVPDQSRVRDPARMAGVGARPGKPPLVARLDLNAADAGTLLALPGIGPTLAGRIVAYREAQGPFQASADLLQVPGMGPRRWVRIRPLVQVRGEP